MSWTTCHSSQRACCNDVLSESHSLFVGHIICLVMLCAGKLCEKSNHNDIMFYSVTSCDVWWTNFHFVYASPFLFVLVTSFLSFFTLLLLLCAIIPLISHQFLSVGVIHYSLSTWFVLYYVHSAFQSFRLFTVCDLCVNQFVPSIESLQWKRCCSLLRLLSVFIYWSWDVWFNCIFVDIVVI